MHAPDRLDPRSTFQDRLADAAARGVRIAKYMALSFALAVVVGIGIGALVADNAFVQIFVTVLAAFGLWLPILIGALAVDSRLERWRSRPTAPGARVIEASAVDACWTRLASTAPEQSERIGAIHRSLASSHAALRGAKLDPDAHDLCVLIDRRLPELIDRQLDSLPPDDRGRREAVSSLIDLVEQFARHCGRKRDGRSDGADYDAEVLRRRFEEQLGRPPIGLQ
jgi:hypothetical protein